MFRGQGSAWGGILPEACPGRDSIVPPASSAAAEVRWVLNPALFTHFVTQAAPVFDRQVAPTRRRFITTKIIATQLFAAELTLLQPVFAHLLPHLAPFIRRQVAPSRLRPCAARRAKQAQEQQRTGGKTFNGRCKCGVSDSTIVRRPGKRKVNKM